MSSVFNPIPDEKIVIEQFEEFLVITILIYSNKASNCVE
jgi:hypothetical protein